MEPLYVIKIGGNIIDNEQALHDFLATFASVKAKKILVHGGGKIASELSVKLGIEPKMLNGKRITDAAALDVVVMTYAGLINKKIVALLQSQQANAIGLSGADGNSIPAQKREVADVDYGFAGDAVEERLNTDFFQLLLSNGMTPVLSAITHDEHGQLLNTNADTIASVLAVAMSAFYNVTLVYCFEMQGVMKDISDAGSMIEQISLREYDILKKNGAVSEGMLPKLDKAFAAVAGGVESVMIGHAKNLVHIIKQEKHAATRIIA